MWCSRPGILKSSWHFPFQQCKRQVIFFSNDPFGKVAWILWLHPHQVLQHLAFGCPESYWSLQGCLRACMAPIWSSEDCHLTRGKWTQLTDASFFNNNNKECFSVHGILSRKFPAWTQVPKLAQYFLTKHEINDILLGIASVVYGLTAQLGGGRHISKNCKVWSSQVRSVNTCY